MTTDIPEYGVIPAAEKSGPFVNIVTKKGVVDEKLPIYRLITSASCKETGAGVEVQRRVASFPVYTDVEVIKILNTITPEMSHPEIVELFAKVENIVRITLTSTDGFGVIVDLER